MSAEDAMDNIKTTPPEEATALSSSAISESELNRMQVCRHLLPEPAPEVVGRLITEIRRLHGVLAASESNTLLAAEVTLQKIEQEMAAEFQSAGHGWPRAWMLEHVKQRAILIKARRILLDRAEAAHAKAERP